ncbi:hypothetical protein LO762_03535 [Actinocorallia sp. API 0066]|uniref:SWIM zinc finger family protein n=1 Tax=Actinocorallia sp. API 0066 TaxID=2896846 RepID=UPI001E3C165D|nr:hypothetical protein [Actinocorallia sp. API 0066]MCD0448271.1 hypothetical protein [Actinocorallia sp. API 0066]
MSGPIRVRRLTPRADPPPQDTRWSRAFLTALAGFLGTAALARGVRGRVHVKRLDVRAYEVTALVQGAREEPYRVTLGLPEIEGWEEIEGELARRPVVRARILGGDLPDEVARVFADCGVPLFPETAEDLHVMCDCPEWGAVCDHALAALAMLAEAFDDDPFLIPAWNGRAPDALRTALRRRPGTADAAPAPPGPPLRADDFWTPPEGLAALRERPAAPPAPPDLLLTLLDPPDVRVRRRPLPDALAPLYRALPDG